MKLSSYMTRTEKERITLMLKIGCLACKDERQRLENPSWFTLRPEVHHLIEGSRRLGHRYTIPLCPAHHRGQWTEEQRDYWKALKIENRPSIAESRKSFYARYGTEHAMWEKVQNTLAQPIAWPVSKIFKRAS